MMTKRRHTAIAVVSLLATGAGYAQSPSMEERIEKFCGDVRSGAAASIQRLEAFANEELFPSHLYDHAADTLKETGRVDAEAAAREARRTGEAATLAIARYIGSLRSLNETLERCATKQP